MEEISRLYGRLRWEGGMLCDRKVYSWGILHALRTILFLWRHSVGRRYGVNETMGTNCLPIRALALTGLPPQFHRLLDASGRLLNAEAVLLSLVSSVQLQIGAASKMSRSCEDDDDDDDGQ